MRNKEKIFSFIENKNVNKQKQMIEVLHEKVFECVGE